MQLWLSEGDGMDNHTKQTDPSVEYLVQMFSEEFLRDLARKTEFIKRQRKSDPVIFFSGSPTRIWSRFSQTYQSA
jgi:hypothetical protein